MEVSCLINAPVASSNFVLKRKRNIETVKLSNFSSNRFGKTPAGQCWIMLASYVIAGQSNESRPWSNLLAHGLLYFRLLRVSLVLNAHGAFKVSPINILAREKLLKAKSSRFCMVALLLSKTWLMPPAGEFEGQSAGRLQCSAVLSWGLCGLPPMRRLNRVLQGCRPSVEVLAPALAG